MAKRLPLLRSMTLTVTERCNLRCAYCYMPTAGGKTMTTDVADAAIDRLAAHAAKDGVVTLSFFGGEPFLARQTIRRAVERAKSLDHGGRLRLVTTTNGLALDASALDLCRDSGMELAVSIDGDPCASERPFADGRASAPSLWAKLPAILALDPGAKIIARMTVTPHNAGELAGNVRALASAGFARIFWSPAYEMDWSDEAVKAYGEAHRRIGEWLAEQRRAGRPVPELLAWRGIEQRLVRGRAKGVCGAGVSSVAVSTDGRLLACYRLLSEPKGSAHELGDVAGGFTHDDALALFASIEPARVKPEDGDCASCSAQSGCTHFCPALGIAMRRDPLAVPASVCELMRAAVRGVRASLVNPATNRRPAMTWVAATVAMVAATTSAACGSTAGGLCPDGGSGGLCPAYNDASADASDASIGFGGLCAQEASVDAPADVDQDATFDDGSMGGGICPPPAPGLC